MCPFPAAEPGKAASQEWHTHIQTSTHTHVLGIYHYSLGCFFVCVKHSFFNKTVVSVKEMMKYIKKSQIKAGSSETPASGLQLLDFLFYLLSGSCE